MPHFTRRPTDRLDDDLRRIAEETGAAVIRMKLSDYTRDDGVTFTNRHVTFIPDPLRSDVAAEDIFDVQNAILEAQPDSEFTDRDWTTFDMPLVKP